MADLRRDGICKIENPFPGLADYLHADYFNFLEKTAKTSSKEKVIALDENRSIYSRYALAKVDKTDRDVKSGIAINNLISFKDPRLETILFNNDLHALLQSYYGRQHFIRNHPAVIKTDWKNGIEKPSNGNFHFDHFHQVTLMYLVNDLEMTDTHMEYAVGSHTYVRTSVSNGGHYFSPKYVYDHYRIVDLVGPRGTLYIFDSAGLHRGKYQQSKNPRELLHLNVTTGHDIESNKFDRLDDWGAFQKLPNPLIQRSFSQILLK